MRPGLKARVMLYCNNITGWQAIWLLLTLCHISVPTSCCVAVSHCGLTVGLCSAVWFHLVATSQCAVELTAGTWPCVCAHCVALCPSPLMPAVPAHALSAGLAVFGFQHGMFVFSVASAAPAGAFDLRRQTGALMWQHASTCCALGLFLAALISMSLGGMSCSIPPVLLTRL